MNWKQRYSHEQKPWQKIYDWVKLRSQMGKHPDYYHFNQTATGGDYFPHAGELSSENFEGGIKPQLSGENLRRHLAEHPDIMRYLGDSYNSSRSRQPDLSQLTEADMQVLHGQQHWYDHNPDFGSAKDGEGEHHRHVPYVNMYEMNI